MLWTRGDWRCGQHEEQVDVGPWGEGAAAIAAHRDDGDAFVAARGLRRKQGPGRQIEERPDEFVLGIAQDSRRRRCRRHR